MPLDTFDKGPVFANWKALRSERYSLIDADPSADFRGLSDNHSGAMVDEETLVDLRARMNVDTCRGVCYLPR